MSDWLVTGVTQGLFSLLGKTLQTLREDSLHPGVNSPH